MSACRKPSDQLPSSPAPHPCPRGRRPQWLSSLVLTVLLSTASASVGDTLVRRDGERLKAPGFSFDGTLFQAPDHPDADRATVADWWLDHEADAAPDHPDAALPEAPDSARDELLTYRQRGAATAATIPGCRGVQVVDDGTYTLTADKRHLYRYHFVGLVLSETLLDWADISLGFTAGRSRQRLLQARCLTPADEVKVLYPDDLKVSVPQGGRDHFDPNARVLSGTIPGVEVGSVVEYTYEYEMYAPEDWRLFFPGFYFQMPLPTCLSRFTVQIPADMKLYWWSENWNGYGAGSWWQRLRALVGLRIAPARHEQVHVDGAEYERWQWEKRDVPPIVTERGMPPWQELAPAVHGTLLRRWDHLNQLTGTLQRERMVANPDLEQLVTDLTAALPDLEAKTARLYHWVQKNIRYVSVKSSLSSGWSGHPAAETLAQGYGDCTDKSVLFATMLKLIGVAAEPVVLRTNDKGWFDPKYPNLHCNHCITEVRLNGRRLYLDCTTQNHRFPSLRADNHGTVAINFIRGERRLIPVPAGISGSGKHTEEEITIDADGRTVVASRNRYAGHYEARLRGGWKRVPEAMKNEVMQQYLNSLAPGARLLDFSMPDPQDLATPFTLEFRYELPDYLSAAGTLRLFQIPDRERHFPEAGLAERRYPLVYTTTEALERVVTITLPPEMAVADLPAAVALDGRHLLYAETYTRQGRQIRLHIRYERKTRRVSVADYAGFRKTAKQIETCTKQPLYLDLRSRKNGSPTTGHAAM